MLEDNHPVEVQTTRKHRIELSDEELTELILQAVFKHSVLTPGSKPQVEFECSSGGFLHGCTITWTNQETHTAYAANYPTTLKS